MRILVILALLLFEVLIITAHAVPTSELHNSNNDVYEIQEGGKPKTTFTAPTPRKPTLREIVYYHVIERPYGENTHLERQSDPEPPQIEMDETMRPFTNGHGYQFADTDLHETEDHDASPHSDATKEGNEEVEDETVSEEVTEEVPADTTTLERLKPVETTEQPIVTTPSEENKNRIRQRQFLFDRLKERYSANFKKPTTTEKAEVETTPTEKVEEITTEASTVASTSTLAFTSTLLPTSTLASTSTPVPESTVTSSESAVRNKRAVNYEEIPLAPTLPPLDYSKYPGLRLYSGIQPMYQTTIYPSNEDDLKKAMKFKINDIFATMRPYNEDKRNNNENDDDIRVETNKDGNDIRVATHKPENRPRTYGMNLSDDQGVVWNNMWRPINYHVGEPVKLYEINEYEVSSVAPVEQDITTTEATTIRTTTTTTTTTTPKPDIEDIFVDVKKHKHTTTAKPTTEPNNEEESETEPKREKEDSIEKEEDKPSSDEKKEDGDNIASKSLLKHKKKPNNVTQEKPSNEVQPDLYQQLMTSDKFWKWLAQWTSNYMEVLSDRVKDMVKEEVAKEMNKYENAHQNIPLNPSNDESKPNNVTKPITSEKDINTTKVATNDEKSANSTEITANKEPVVKNNTLIVDGKEIPITNNTNFDQGNNDFLRKIHDENKRPNKNKLPDEHKLVDKKENDNKNNTLSKEKQPDNKHEENYNNVKAVNVYGSSTGNDKVTNIFIFYPGTESEKIIDGLKPYLNNSITGIATSVKDDKKSEEENKNEKVTEKPIDSTSLAHKEPENVTTQKPVKNNDKAEKKSDDNKTSANLEANKESLNSTVTKPLESEDKKETLTENKDTTEKASEKEVSSTTETPKSDSTEVTTEKADESTTAPSTSTLAPLNSTTLAQAEDNSTSLAIEANSTSTPTILTH